MRSKDPVAMLHDVSYCALQALDPGRDPYPDHTARGLRRLRVFTLTAAKPVLERVNHPTCNAAAEVCWRIAEGTVATRETAVTQNWLRVTYHRGVAATRPHYTAPPELWVLPRLVNVLTLLFNEPDAAARRLITPLSLAHPGEPVPLLTPDETRNCCGLLREICGPRGVLLVSPDWEESWRTDTAIALARQMYETGDFSAMPILADALQDAGCITADVLTHCRDANAKHVRGCWVVDDVLGKGKRVPR
jgi:hypothetical protein